jgi:ATP-dependent DNA ligase
MIAQRKSAFAISPHTAPMEAKLVDALPEDPVWQFEPKWDGFRCLAFRKDNEIEIRGKSGKSLSRFFPEVVTALSTLSTQQFVLDGELAIPRGSSLSFEALQMRLHPAATRIRKLSAQTPAIFILFDCLVHGSRTLLDAPLTERRRELEKFFDSLQSNGLLRLSPYTRKRSDAARWLRRVGGALDGVVAKRIDDVYRPGERAMLKVKRIRTADCVVGGFRYETKSNDVGSLLLGLFDDAGKLNHVGFTSAIPKADRRPLTTRLEKLIAPPGFTGNAPGAPSRWSTKRSTEWEPLKTKLVVEVQYDHISGGRFRHGTKLLRWRPDKSPRQCTFEQLEASIRPSEFVKRIACNVRP